MPEPLTLEEVAHIARLARLALTEEELEAYRGQLSAVLEHVARLSELDLVGVEPLLFPGEGEPVNRLDEDVVQSGGMLTIEQLAQNAPAMEGRYIAVPKVLEEGE